MPVQGAQNVIHRLIITSATTQRLSNNIYSTQVGPNSGVIRNQAGNHRDHRTVRHDVQNQGESRTRGNIEKAYLPISPPSHLLFQSINKQDFI
jgi:beta-mannanase